MLICFEGAREQAVLNETVDFTDVSERNWYEGEYEVADSDDELDMALLLLNSRQASINTSMEGNASAGLSVDTGFSRNTENTSADVASDILDEEDPQPRQDSSGNQSW